MDSIGMEQDSDFLLGGAPTDMSGAIPDHFTKVVSPGTCPRSLTFGLAKPTPPNITGTLAEDLRVLGILSQGGLAKVETTV